MKMLTIIWTTLFISSAAQAVKFEIKNLEIGALWVGIKEDSGKAQIEDGGFQLASGQSRAITVPDNWSGKIWPRTWCGWPRANECLTGDCGKRLQCGGNDAIPPYTHVYIKLKGDGGLDTYYVSLSGGYNIGLAIEPVNGVRNESQRYSCSKAACVFNFQQDCPGQLLVRHENYNIACKSPCVFFETDEHCCHDSNRNDTVLPEICKSLEWRDIHPGHFKQYCPDALTYAHDKQNIFNCKSDSYLISLGGAW